jgi:hypothetical protein
MPQAREEPPARDDPARRAERAAAATSGAVGTHSLRLALQGGEASRSAATSDTGGREGRSAAVPPPGAENAPPAATDASPTGGGPTTAGTPVAAAASPRARQLLQSFLSSPRSRGTDKGTVGSFTGLTGSEFEREANRPGATSESIRTTKDGVPWTYRFVVVATGTRVETFIRESQDDTQVVNYYQRSVDGTVSVPAWFTIRVENAIFAAGTAEFDFGSSAWGQFYATLDADFEDIASIPYVPEPPALPGTTLASQVQVVVTLREPRSPLATLRVARIRQDLVARGAKAMNVTAVYGSTLADTDVTLDITTP